jgi:hypothetical protein
MLREESALRLDRCIFRGSLFGFPGSRLGPLKQSRVKLTTLAQ